MRKNILTATALTCAIFATRLEHSVAGNADSNTPPAFAEGKDDVFVTRLRVAGITTNVAGVRDFLANVTASPEQRRIAKTWIRQLGSPSYDERIQAMEQLRRRRIALAPELQQGQTNSDPEIALRCSRLLHDHNPELQDTLFIAVLETIVRRRYRGLLVPIERVFEHSSSPDVYRAAIDAVVITTTPADIPTLQDWLRSPQIAKRVLAIHAMGRHSQASQRNCSEFLDHWNSSVRLAAATALARHTPRTSLATCVQLLNADQAWIRHDAACVLREITGQRFGYWAYADPPRRKHAIQKWSDWLATSSPTSELRPLPVSWRFRKWLGQRLICRWEANTLEEFDQHQRSDLAVTGFNYPWGCWGTPQGHRLVVDTELRKVIELDSTGTVIWKREQLPGYPTSVQRLKNGNTLLALSDPNQLVEYDPHGELVWQFPIKSRPTTAQRLPNGDTLVNLQHADRVVLVKTNGDVETLVEGLNEPYTAEMLDNGNILVCNTDDKRVDEFDSAGQVVWTIANLQNPAQAQRLPNGNTLVSDQRGLFEFSPDGQTVDHWPLIIPHPFERKSDRVRFHFY